MPVERSDCYDAFSLFRCCLTLVIAMPDRMGGLFCKIFTGMDLASATKSKSGHERKEEDTRAKSGTRARRVGHTGEERVTRVKDRTRVVEASPVENDPCFVICVLRFVSIRCKL